MRHVRRPFVKRCFSGLLGLAAVVLAAGCAPDYDMHAVEAFLTENRSPVSGTEYRVLPPDSLSIASDTVTEINGLNLRIRPDGKINLPLLGELEVAGKTPAEIEDLLVKAAGKYYERADVTVQITGYNSQRYYVLGHVSGGGAQAWTGTDTLLDALARARPTDMAWVERVRVLRAEEPTKGGYSHGLTSEEHEKEYSGTGVHPETEEHQRHEMTVNLLAMMEEGDLSNNVLLKPDDIVYVQPHPFAEVTLFLRKILMPVNPVISTVTAPRQVTEGAETAVDYNDDDDDD